MFSLGSTGDKNIVGLFWKVLGILGVSFLVPNDLNYVLAESRGVETVVNEYEYKVARYMVAGAILYKRGDFKAAFTNFFEAAELGKAEGQQYVADMYANGLGVPKDDAEAVRWYRRAAKQGLVDAQFNLGLMYAEGRGVPRNLVLAYKWESIAAAQGDEGARHNLGISESQMTRKQIAEAQRLAAMFSSKEETPGAAQARPSAPSASSQAIASASVRNIQRDLAALGYDPGPADGLIGPRTTGAIQAFQRDLGIEPDGIASSTLEALLTAVVEDKRATPPSVLQEKQASTGTGFFVSDSGHVLTNYHVVESCSKIRLVLSDGHKEARIIASRQGDDLAVLHAETKPPAVAAFRRTAGVLGEDILVAGYPLRGLLSGINVTSGSISATSGIEGDARYMQITAPVQPGNSGGPLLDGAGFVVGVVVGKLDAISVAQVTGDIPQNVNFAIKGVIARSFLSIHGIEYREAAPGRDKRRAAIAEEAQKHSVLVECWK